PGMIERGRGGVLNVASMAGLAPSPGSATYGATKAYAAAFPQSRHPEAAAKGVHVTAPCPGSTPTAHDAPANPPRLPRAALARAGLEAVAAGRALCVPGAQYKAAFPPLKLVPRPLLRAAVTRMWQQAADSR